METFNKIILNIPHDGTEQTTGKWKGNIEQHIKKWHDTKVRQIFLPYIDKAVSVPFCKSRFDCDVERLENDPLKEMGQGIYYTKFEDCTRKYNFDEHKHAVEDWLLHRYAIIANLVPNSLIIDCHSFPSEVCEDIDINIGFNEDFSKPSAAFITFLADFFEQYGYKVGINKPYSNSITPTQELAYKSVMIELNKKIYLNEDTNELLSSAYKINQMLNYLYKNILGQQ